MEPGNGAVSNPRATIVWLSGLFAFSLWMLSPFVDSYYLHVFEADAQSTVDFTSSFASGKAFHGQPKPDSYPPYFDVPYILYAGGILTTDFLRHLNAIDSSSLPTPLSVAVFAIRHVNLAAYALSVTLMALIVWQTTRWVALSTILAGFVLFSPNLSNIDLLRVDHPVLALFLANVALTLYTSRADTSPHWSTHVASGILASALALTKISSLPLVFIPVSGYFVRWRHSSWRASGLPYFLAGLLASGAFFLARFLPYELSEPGFTVKLLFAKMTALAQWSSVLPSKPRFYYNVEQFAGYGPVFACSFAVALGSLCLDRPLDSASSFRRLLILGLLVAFSVFGFFSFKYPRGLYLLIPVYVMVIAAGIPALCRNISSRLPPFRASKNSHLALLSAALMLGGLYWPCKAYLAAEQMVERESDSILQTRILPARWISSQVQPQVRVTIPVHSEWANPPLDQLNAAVAYRFMNFPYLDPTKMGTYHPPTMAEVASSTDVVVLNSFHYNFFLATFASQNHEDLRREWEAFFRELRATFLTRRFAAQTPNYGVEWVDVIVVHPNRETARGK